jgi:UDP-N-acetylmuramyl pentapeptide synthase
MMMDHRETASLYCIASSHIMGLEGSERMREQLSAHTRCSSHRQVHQATTHSTTIKGQFNG